MCSCTPSYAGPVGLTHPLPWFPNVHMSQPWPISTFHPRGHCDWFGAVHMTQVWPIRAKPRNSECTVGREQPPDIGWCKIRAAAATSTWGGPAGKSSSHWEKQWWEMPHDSTWAPGSSSAQRSTSWFYSSVKWIPPSLPLFFFLKLFWVLSPATKKSLITQDLLWNWHRRNKWIWCLSGVGAGGK